MEMTKREFVGLYQAYSEIIGSKECKSEPKVSGKHIYLIVKGLNELTPHFKEVFDKEQAIKRQLTESLSVKGANEKELSQQANDDLTELFNETLDVEPYKIPQDLCEVMAKHLSGASTEAMFTFACA